MALESFDLVSVLENGLLGGLGLFLGLALAFGLQQTRQSLQFLLQHLVLGLDFLYFGTMHHFLVAGEVEVFLLYLLKGVLELVA